MNPEIDIAGIFVSSVVPGALLSLLATLLLRRLLGAIGLYRLLWHPALFDAALFFILWAIIIALPAKV